MFRLANLLKLAFISLVLTGCATGTLQKDISAYSSAYNPTKNDETIYVNFIYLPGIASARMSTMVPAGGIFVPIEGHGSVDCDPIARDMVVQVFSLKFAEVVLGEPAKNNGHPYKILEIDATASTSSMNGHHTANISGTFTDAQNSLLFQSQTEHVVDDWQYAQEDSMQRAFYGAFHKLLVRYDEYLTTKHNK